ncbi:MAG: hypothetical protein ACOH12_03410 [Parvibaculaceae bacterium]
MPMDINLTSTAIPLSLLAVLSLYMYVLFRRERSEAMAYAAAGGDAPGYSTTMPTPAPVADHGHTDHGNHGEHVEPTTAVAPAVVAAPAPHAPQVVATPVKRKRRLFWSNTYIWLPLVAGFCGQAYLDFGGHAYYLQTIKPMIEKSTS